MKQKFWFKLEVPNWEIISDLTLKYIEKFNIIDKVPRNGFILLDYKNLSEYCPILSDCLNIYNNSIIWAGLYITRDDAFSKIHIDYDGDQHECRLNIPVLNCRGSKTEFYEGGTYNAITQNNGLNFLTEISGHAVKVDEVEVDSPTILNIKKPHKVLLNDKKLTRITLTLYTKTDLIEYLK